MEKTAAGEVTFKSDVEQLPLEDVCKTRLWVYRFLSRHFYREPVLEELEQLVTNNLFQQLSQMEDEEQNEGLKLLADFIMRVPQLTKLDLDIIRHEYQRLFIGPEHLPAPPWESVYLSEERIIMDEHTLAVREFYREWGVEVVNFNRDPDDHIGLELEFMALLTEKALEYSQSGNKRALKQVLDGQRVFLHRHLFRWVDQFCSCLAQNTDEPLYRGMALFTPAYLRMDDQLLADLISSLEQVDDEDTEGVRNEV